MHELIKDKKDDVCKILAMAVFKQAIDDYIEQRVLNNRILDKTALAFIKEKNDYKKYLDGINKCLYSVEKALNNCFETGNSELSYPSYYDLYITRLSCKYLHEYIQFKTVKNKNKRIIKIVFIRKQKHAPIHFPI